MMKNVAFLALVIGCASCGKTTRFERLSSNDTGVDFINVIEEKDSFNILHDEYMYNGGGVGAADLNNDGLTDLIFSGNKVSCKIYLNQGEFKFTDITKNFDGLNDQQWFSGVAVVDINSDGWKDIYFTSTSGKDPAKRKNKLWVNQGNNAEGNPTFKEQAAEYGIDYDGYTVHAGFFDYDLDGDLDLYLLNNIVNRSVPTNYRPKIVDGTSINNDKLFRNEGNGKFTDVTIEAGIVYEGYGLGLAFGDINKDGYPDIYVSNDYISNDILYINQRNGTFKNMSEEYQSYQSRFSMGNEMVDMNNDGNLDIMSVDMMPELYARKKQTINGNSYVVYINNEKYHYQPQYVRNMVHFHNGFVDGKMLPMSEVGQMVGLFETEWSWSPLFADYDNDGDRDLLMTNGFPKDLTDKDFTNYKAQVYGFVATDKHILPKIPIVKVTNYAFENTGPYSFEDKTEDWGMKLPCFSNGAAFADLDNDGDLDYVVNNINEKAFVYKNNTIGKLNDHPNYISIRLKGKSPNAQAIGAKTEIWFGGHYAYHELFLNRGYISSVDPVVHFGLSDHSQIDSVVIHWPNGKERTRITNPTVNQVLTIDEATAEKSPERSLIHSTKRLFETVESALPYRHMEQDYIDFFQNQRIIQHKFSQIGPCIVKGDLNSDGQEDILIGGSVDTPTAAFLRNGSIFQAASLPGLTDKKACNEADMAIVDIDGDGDQDVVSVSGGYSVENDADYQHCVYINNSGKFDRHVLPVPAFTASIVRSFDYDHDGDLDLFIGARVKRFSFPFAPESYLVINDKGNFSAQPLKLDLGMVTDAVWSDYDKDGWEDLIVSREWNSIVVLKNDNGKALKTQKLDAIESMHGLWSAVAAADIDKDGDDDYILGNLGDNHRFTVSNEYPMRMYGIDVDKNSFIDPILTSYWKDIKGKMQEYPVNYLDELAAQSPFFRKRFTSYTKFSLTPMDSIYTRDLVPAEALFTVNTTSSYILWNEKGKFTWEKLPAEVQSSPVKKMIVSDFNNDGRNDILFGGNDHSFDVSTGYFDANKGIILFGKDGKSFDVRGPSQTGLLLNGQVTSLVLLPGANPLIVAGINRDSVRVYRATSGDAILAAMK